MIREADKDDCLNLAALSIQVWLHAYAKNGLRDVISSFVLDTFTVQHFMEIINNPKLTLLVYIKNEHLVGYVIANPHSIFENTNNGFEIDTLYVQEHFQGMGIGKKLLNRIRIQFGEACWVSTWSQNGPAIRFYKHLGFSDIGAIDFHLGDEAHENRVLAIKWSGGD